MRLMRYPALLFGSVALLTTFTAIGGADTLTLRTGQAVEGTWLGGTSRQVRIEVNGEVETYDVAQVQSVFFADQATPPAMPSPQSRPADAPPTDRITIPADTRIIVRMVDSVNSDISRTGQTFMATLDEPIMVNGNPAISRGADVMTKLVYDQNSGTLQGRTVLTLALASIKVNGQWVDVSTTDVRTASASQGQKSAKVVGGTTALGAILGGIAGGGKGAAIGAGSGAAVGTGAAVVTSGEKVSIPSETRLTFRLQTAVHL